MSESKNFKGKAGTFAAKAAGAAKNIASKTKHVGRIAKLNMDIAGERDAINRAYEEIGKLYYENHRDDPEGLLAHSCRSITASFAAIAAMEEAIEQLKTKGEQYEPMVDFQNVVDETENEAEDEENLEININSPMYGDVDEEEVDAEIENSQSEESEKEEVPDEEIVEETASIEETSSETEEPEREDDVSEAAFSVEDADVFEEEIPLEEVPVEIPDEPEESAAGE